MNASRPTTESTDCRTMEGLVQQIARQGEEIDSLTSQVVDDFEELTLLRTLAGSVGTLSTGDTVEKIVDRFIAPLSAGIGAQAVVAVMNRDEPRSDDVIRWSADLGISDDALRDFLENQQAAATIGPVVLNHFGTEETSEAPHGLSEVIVIECRSGSHLHGWLVACNRTEEMIPDVSWTQHGFTTVQATLLETAAGQLAGQLNNQRLFKQREDMFTDMVRALVNAVEARDPYTCGHSERVARFAKHVAELIHLPTAECEQIYLAGLLHDIGKIAIPDHVLQKPGKLTDEERAVIETHTESGWQILHQFDALQGVLPGVLYHHEHFNGRGYPDGLVGTAIPLVGRILAVCDAFDAMTSDRPYRAGMPIEKACRILEGGASSFWDPELVDVFVNNQKSIDQVRRAHHLRRPARRAKSVGGQPALQAIH